MKGEKTMRLYGFWRSSASWRVRIALHWKGLPHATIPLSLVAGEQHDAAYAAINPQGFVPFLVDGEAALGQSLTIIEYLDETHPEPPLLPGGPIERARARMLAQTVACDIHPLNNLRVLKYVRRELGQEQAGVDAWARHWIAPGFAALEAAAERACGLYLAGDAVTIADLCLVPQIYNARRVDTDLAPYPRLIAIEARLMALPAFAETHPDRQPDAIPPAG
ncbi:maleylacetoacetate isomerase [Sphingomonas bacterium]|uniref:maleylacetoacetate isomerase n=1 Tax=Sphingomonas bacterium TaxID=1895847 RepID=UPI0020C65197|nr:maleylacetoacetate isomerase [Sphingomonas bacterium]